MKFRRFMLALALTLGVASAVYGDITISSIQYTETGPTESVVASFLTADGGVSLSSYSGLVKLTVSGTGEALGTQLNDAFYVYTNASHAPIVPVNDVNYYQLAAKTSTLNPLEPAFDAKHDIFYDIDADVEVTPTYVPAYRSDHTYTFVWDTGAGVPTALHFGVSNGIFSDNSGHYDIDITQLVPIPAPAAAILGLLGVGMVGGVRRRCAT